MTTNIRVAARRPAMWQDSGERTPAVDRAIPRRPDAAGVPTSPIPAVPSRAAPGRPLAGRIGWHLRGIVDRMIAASSLVSNDPVLDMRDFAWTAALRQDWQAIRGEAMAEALRGRAARGLTTISPDYRAIAEDEPWRSCFLWGHGDPVADNLTRCPRTAAAVARIPGLNSASFSILAPGTHVPAHRGMTKGLITCHLGLIVPRDGDVRMRIADRIVRWAEGETLVFDDTYDHEVWNQTHDTRVVLLVRFERPLRNPGRWIADLVLSMIGVRARGAREYRGVEHGGPADGRPRTVPEARPAKAL